MQTLHLRCIPLAASLPSLRTPLSTTCRLSPPFRPCRLTRQQFSACHTQERRLIHNSLYNRVHLHAKNLSTDSKPQATAMTETVIREVAKDVWIFSK